MCSSGPQLNNTKKLLLGFRCWLIQRRGPVHTDRRFFDLDVAAGAGFDIQGSAIIIYFIDGAMDTGDRNDLTAEHDDIADTIDYAVVTARIRRELGERHFNLIESLGEFVVNLLFDSLGGEVIAFWPMDYMCHSNV